MSFVSFESANEIGDRFLSLLSRLQINPPQGSAPEDELLSLTHLIEVMKDPNLAQGDDEVKVLRSAAGIHDLAAKVLSVETLPEFPNLVPHLRLLAEDTKFPASLGQNAKHDTPDDTDRKIAELYIGCLAAHVGTQVVLDSPTKPQGDNPDVVFLVEEEGADKAPQRWALAIKSISSRVGQTIFERIRDGARQIDHEKCAADVGMVIINAKNALCHDVLWNSSFPDLETARDAVRNQIEKLAESANTDRPSSEWDALFEGKVVRPVIFMGQSLVTLPTPAGPRTPTQIKVFMAYGAGGSEDTVGIALAIAMNEHMQRILKGRPGGAGYFPE